MVRFHRILLWVRELEEAQGSSGCLGSVPGLWFGWALYIGLVVIEAWVTWL